MKKHYIKIIVILFFIILLTTFAIVLINKQNEHRIKPAFIINPKNYSLVAKEDNLLEITVYASENAQYYLNKAIITDTFLINEDDKAKISLNLKQITSTKTMITSDEILYEGYLLSFSLPIISGESLSFKNTLLELHYSNGQINSFSIGSFFLLDHEYYLNNNPIFIVNKLKPIVNSISDQLSIGGIIIELTNQFVNNVNIKKMELLDAGASLNMDSAICITVDDYLNQTPISTILNNEYHFYDQKINENTDIVFKNNETQQLFIPLTYQRLQFIQTIGILITYISNDITYTQIINPVILFQTTELNNYQVVTNAEN